MAFDLDSPHPLFEAEEAASAGAPAVPDLDAYDRIVLFFSFGKDSIAALLHLLELGVPKHKIVLHHHHVDGDGENFMDWPVTAAFGRAFAEAFGLQLEHSWKHGGLLGEIMRWDQPTAPSMVPIDGQMVAIGGEGKLGRRRKFPQQSASLTTRFCSAYAKIGVSDAYLSNDPKFLTGKTLVVTGERAEESSARANYKVFEPHRRDNRDGARVKRWIDHWRAVHSWTSAQVWEIIKRHRVRVHPAYYLGWGRLSCRQCIFGSINQWASVKQIAPIVFNKIADMEREFGVTIHRKMSVIEQAERGTPYEMDPQLVAIANSTTYDLPIFMDDWVLPSGAFGEACGPT